MFIARKQIGCEDFTGKGGGEGITIAVLDTGISTHPDFGGRILAFRDFVNGMPYVYDDSGHGTHVCGIAAGNGQLSRGRYRGVAPRANLVVGKVLNEQGDGSVDAMLKGLSWILENKDRWRICIVNISVGLGGRLPEKREILLREKMEEVWEEGLLVVCAAGNNGPAPGSISYMGESPRLITVGCYDKERRNGKKSCETYSARGREGVLYRKPDLVAPGTEIVSCNAFYRKAGARTQGAYTAKSGTSMATPMVSGCLALLLEKSPYLSKEQAKYRLLKGCVRLKEPDNLQGYGMLYVKRVLTDSV